MATVWAYRVGTWLDGPGWSHCLRFTGLPDLVVTLGASKLAGAVTHLAIVAHGDAPGQVQLDRPMHPTTVTSFAAELAGIGVYLTRDGMLTFYSCIAGAGPEGTQLLKGLSMQLPGRTVVGFEMFGLMGTTGQPTQAGRLIAVQHPDPVTALQPKNQFGNIDPFGPWAKRVKDGVVLHIPKLEQNGRPNKRCANPACPGHSDPGHSCRGW